LQGRDARIKFADLFGAVPGPLRPYLPSFRHALVDLAPMDDQALSNEVRLRAYLKVLKYSRHPDVSDCIDQPFCPAERAWTPAIQRRSPSSTGRAFGSLRSSSARNRGSVRGCI
jgi:hypothetical protein